MIDEEKICKFCGFEFDDRIIGGWKYPDGIYHALLPPIDANFIVEHVLPKLRELNIHLVAGRVVIYDANKTYLASGDDFVEAFKQALLKLIEE